MNQITPQLRISDIDSVRQQPIDVDIVISVCQESVGDNISNSTEYHQVALEDGDSEYVNGCNCYDCFEEAVETTLRAVERGRTLVHCHRGRSRSAAVCIATIAIRRGWTYVEAQSLVATARPCIDPDEMLIDHAQRAIMRSEHFRKT